MRNIVVKSLLAAGLLAMAAGASQAKSLIYPPYTPDGTYAYNYKVIAGVTPDFYSTFIRGQRCHYEYRVQFGLYGKERIRVVVCN
jgi:hypothetical protein